MERARLKAARLQRHWTLKEAAAHLETDANTLNRWELGKSKPRSYSIRLLCNVYNVNAYDLDLGDSLPSIDLQQAATANTPLTRLISNDITICLLALPVAAHRSSSLEFLQLQHRVKLTVEDFDAMNTDSNDYPITRREALRRLALVPIQILKLNVLSTSLSLSEDILAQCAAGIVACEYLSNGVDLPLAFQIVSTYLPTLITLIKDSSAHRQAAAHLTTQCLFLQTILSMHLEGFQEAAQYAQQAITYSEASNDIPLQITSHGRLAWVYSCQKQNKLALEQALKAKSLLQLKPNVLPSPVHSYVYGVLAKYQALNGQKDTALKSLRSAHEAFFAPGRDENGSSYAYMDHDLSNFLLDDGTTHIFMGKSEDALASFAHIIAPDDLHSKIPVAERIRVEVLNYQTIASLKTSKKDMEQSIHFWKAAIAGAKTLQSEQRFAEACTAFEMMECVWSHEKRIEELRDLMVHW